MHMPATIETGSASAAALTDWLPPSLALDRYVPPEGVMALIQEEKVEERRYGFRVGSFGFLIPPHVGSEALAMSSIAPIPNSAPWLRGMINLRGALVPVFDLALVLGSPRQAHRECSNVLVFDKGTHAVGLVINDFPKQLTKLVRMVQIPELPTALKGNVTAGYTYEGSLWLEFEHKQFFNSLNN
jgi:twitching motility protein PilI